MWLSDELEKTTVRRCDTMISIKGLYKKFGELEVLKGIDLEVNKGEVVVVIGPSGSGKTTLLRCLNILEVPTAGKYNP